MDKVDSSKTPLQQLVYQGSPGKSLLLNKYSGASHSSSPQCKSENCDPNLEKANVPGGASALVRKNDVTGAAESTLEDNHKELTGKDHVSFCEPREGDSAGGEEGDQSTCKEKDATTHKCGGKGSVGQQLLKSPTTAASPGGGHGHGHRQHYCRSPRCASNNPDYASPAQVPPRKYLVSKRHLLPGAICTRDPSTLPSSQIPLPPSSSTGKAPARPPPSSACKLPTTNTFRQLSFKDASSDTSKFVATVKEAMICSPLDISCGGPATGAAGAARNNIVGSNPDELFQNKERSGSETASETQLQEQQQEEDRVEQKESVNCDCSSPDVGLRDDSGQDVEKSRSDENDGGCIPELNSVDSETSSNVEAKDTDLTVVDDVQIHGSVEVERCESPDFSAQAGESSDSSARAVPLPPCESPSEEEPVPVASCGLTDRQVPDEVLLFGASVLELADDLPLDVADVTETLEQRLALEEMDETSLPGCQSSGDDGVVDIYDLAAAASTYESEEGGADIERDYILQDCPTEEGRRAENCDCVDAEVSISQISGDDFDVKTSEDCQADEVFDVVECVIESPDVLRESETSFCESTQEPEAQRALPRFGRSKGRQLWRNDCRDSREVVTLRPTKHSRRSGDWMVDSLLEGAVNRLKPSGEGRVRLLVEAFESLMNIREPEPEKRPSRLWCFNRRGKGEVDDDGDECEEGDQRVDCYEVSGDRFELRASMRLSLGGSSRRGPSGAEDDEEVSLMQKVHDWDDRQDSGSNDKKDFDGDDQDGNNGISSAKKDVRTARRQSEVHTKTDDRKRVEMYNEVKLQLGYKTEDNVMMKIQRYNRQKGSSKSSSVKSDTESKLGSAEKSARALRNTNLEPFRLLTEERGALKEYQFAKKLEQLFAEEERLRNPIAQGLPWTTDEPEVVPKPPVKQPTKHVDFTHHSDSRAAIRAEFDQYMAEREMYIKMQKEEEERRRQIAEEEEIRRLRREMVPRAQLMPFFDQPFMPTRSSKRLTVPKEPNFKMRGHKRAKCMVFQHGAS